MRQSTVYQYKASEFLIMFPAEPVLRQVSLLLFSRAGGSVDNIVVSKVVLVLNLVLVLKS